MRLAGVHALANLADDWPDQRQVCVDVLCAYLRMPYSSHPKDADYDAAEPEVRRTIFKIIGLHCQKGHPQPWSDYPFDFSGARVDDVDLNRAVFQHSVDFSRCEISGFVMNGCHFKQGADFDSVAVEDQTLMSFNGGSCRGGLSFREAEICGHLVINCHLVGAIDFDEATLTDVALTIMPTAGSEDVEVIFTDATFASARVEIRGNRVGRLDVSFADVTSETSSTGRWMTSVTVPGHDRPEVTVAWGPFNPNP